MMVSKTIPIGELVLLAGTRAMLGAGVGLLVAERMGQTQRRTAAWTLLAIGVVTTLPLLEDIFGQSSAADMLNRRANRKDV